VFARHKSSAIFRLRSLSCLTLFRLWSRQLVVLHVLDLAPVVLGLSPQPVRPAHPARRLVSRCQRYLVGPPSGQQGNVQGSGRERRLGEGAEEGPWGRSNHQGKARCGGRFLTPTFLANFSFFLRVRCCLVSTPLTAPRILDRNGGRFPLWIEWDLVPSHRCFRCCFPCVVAFLLVLSWTRLLVSPTSKYAFALVRSPVLSFGLETAACPVTEVSFAFAISCPALPCPPLFCAVTTYSHNRCL